MNNSPNSVAQVFCPNCGGGNPPAATACGWCRVPLIPVAPAWAPPAAGLRPVSYSTPGPALRLQAPKDPNTALLLELLGFFGFLGIGNMWAGKVGKGILLLIGYWVFAVFVVVGPLLTMVADTSGITALCLMCGLALVYLATPIVSGVLLRNQLRREQGW